MCHTLKHITYINLLISTKIILRACVRFVYTLRLGQREKTNSALYDKHIIIIS